MFTELSDNCGRGKTRGWILYDAECPFCLGLLERFRRQIVAGNFWIPSILDYRGNLERVTPFVRQVFNVHWLYIILTLMGFAGLCLFFAPELAAGTPLARAICTFLAAFWLLRVVLQFGYYDRGVRAKYRCGDIAYTLAISSLGCVFAVLAMGGGK